VEEAAPLALAGTPTDLPNSQEPLSFTPQLHLPLQKPPFSAQEQLLHWLHRSFHRFLSALLRSIIDPIDFFQ